MTLANMTDLESKLLDMSMKLLKEKEECRKELDYMIETNKTCARNGAALAEELAKLKEKHA